MLPRLALTTGLAAVLLGTAGCASYGDGIEAALHQLEKGDYERAGARLERALSPRGDDRLLFFLERGTLAHLAGDYRASNEALERAHNLADEMRSRAAADRLAGAVLNPREAEYRGTDVERVYINYYKALNYLMLAQRSGSAADRAAHLESAGVEIRRLGNKLSAIRFEEGSYEAARDEEEGAFRELMALFRRFLGNGLDPERLVFREDAYLRYLAGVLYEKSGELDDARIAYERAARLYEEGYREQYRLDGGVAEQAWLDAIRVMRRAGGYEQEWRQLARRKLSAQGRERLEALGPRQGQLLVIQHLGMVPRLQEMNLRMTAHPERTALRLHPVPTGDAQRRRDQRRWFHLLYADKGLKDVLVRYLDPYTPALNPPIAQKTVILGPAWQAAQELSIPQGVGKLGIRVTVPFYSPLRTELGESRVRVEGESGDRLLQAESVSQLVIQNRLLRADREVYAALARATLKNVTAAQLGEELGGTLGRLAGKALASGSSAAETRSWLTMPYAVRIARIPVEPGEHTVRLTTSTRAGGTLAQSERRIAVEPGQTRVWIQRTMDPTQRLSGVGR